MKLKEKVQLALDESRMLILGIQVLLGFAFEAFFMSGFDQLPRSARVVKLASLGLLLVATALLLAPVARHRIVDRGRDTPRLHAFTRTATAMALAPFALALGAEFYLVGCRVDGPVLGLALAIAVGVSSAVAWYLVPFLLRRRDRHPEDSVEETELNDRIRHVLTEARVVLPGTQALLGFQFAATLQQGFDALPTSSKVVHVVALAFLGLSVVFLMLPAAYHRIAEGGEISERLHRFSSACILLAMGTLAVALAADIFIVVRKATGSVAGALGAALVWLAVAIGAWFVLMLAIRARHRSGKRPSAAARTAARAT